jgi:hypothetical protein
MHTQCVTPDERFYGDTCYSTCDSGYTLDQLPAGDSRFDITCLATGEFSEPTKCLPVLCGPPRDVSHAHISDGTSPSAALVYPQVVKYECNEGFSLDAKYGGPIEFETDCKADAIFHGIEVCKNVECGLPPHTDHAQYPKAMVTYNHSATYVCVLG